VECKDKPNQTAITTDPEEIDKQLQTIWGKIHAGTSDPSAKLTRAGPS
jgi:hypothetical protein